MSITEFIAVAGTTSTILGIFLTLYGIIKNKVLKSQSNLIREEIKAIREEIKAVREEIKEFRKETKIELRKIAELIVADGERTRELVRKLKFKSYKK